MTVNPNPLSRAQWLFSTSFLLDKHRQAQPWFPCSAVAHICLFCISMAMEPQYGNQLNPGETCPCPHPQHQAGIPGCRFALGQKPSCSPRSIITPNGRDLLGEKRYVGFLKFWNALPFVQVQCGDSYIPIYKLCRNVIWWEPAWTGFRLTAKDLFGFLCWKLCLSRGVGWGEPDGPMNIVVMDKSRGGDCEAGWV